MNWRMWLHGLVATAIQGAATSVTALIVAPEAFHDWHKLGALALVSGLMGAAMYLKQSPLPNGASPAPPAPPAGHP